MTHLIEAYPGDADLMHPDESPNLDAIPALVDYVLDGAYTACSSSARTGGGTRSMPVSGGRDLGIRRRRTAPVAKCRRRRR